MTRRIAAALAVLFATISVRPQQPPSPVISETVEVSIVNVDVFVTDRKGKRVHGLTKDDFEIYDGKVRQTISNFSEYSSATAADAARPGADSAVAPPQKRTVVLFFERTEQIDYREAERFATRARQMLETVVRPEDSVTLVIWDELAKLEWIEGRPAIEAKLDELPEMFNVGRANRDARAYSSAWLEDETRSFDAAISGGRNANAPPNTQLGSARTLRMIQLQNRMTERVAAIHAVINAMAPAEGKKILILAPQSLGEVGLLESTRIATNPYGKGNMESTGMIARLVESANGSGVTIYTIYATRMLPALPDSTTADFASAPNPAGAVNQAYALASVAADTGGLAAHSFADALDLLPRIEEDVTDYYSLAFRSDSGNRVHDIEVRTKNPDYVVRSRRQYVDKSDAMRARDQITAALLHPPLNPFGLTATAGAIAKSRGRETVALAIRIPIAALTTLPTGSRHAGAFEVWVGAGSAKGLLSAITQKAQTFELADVAAAQNGFFTYRLEVMVDRNADRIAVAVIDAVSKESSLIRVPVDRALTVSSH
jgi:VWFA-related protein